MKTLENNQT